jgi:Na+/H+ antiporter NhaC
MAIVLAITTRQVLLSLGGGIWLGYCVLYQTNPIKGLALSIDGVINVFQDPGNTMVIVFTLVVGGLISTMEHTGGVKGFVSWLEQRQWVNSGRRAQLLAWFIGIVIFVESNLTLLVAGSVSRPLFDRFRISREKLAYIIDSTSAPICILIPFNAWGAFNIGLISSTGEANPFNLFVEAIPLNLYAIFAVLLAGVSIIWRRDIGPMKAAEQRTRDGEVLWPDAVPMVDPSLLASETDHSVPPRARHMILPIVTMVIALPVGLLITGQGDITAGSGSTSVLWAVFAGLTVAWLLSLFERRHNTHQLVDFLLKGAGGMVPVAVVLLLSMALGHVAKDLQAGQYLSGVVQGTLPLPLLLPLIFVVSAAIAFSVGSSWGTFAIMIPIALPLAVSAGLPPAPFLAAVLSGAIFGDHASPISDTTIVASMAAATDHIDHVRTQLPYALISGSIALLGFTIMGLMI